MSGTVLAGTLSIVLPVFGLIALGYVAARSGLVAPETAKGVAEFTFTLAIPALLFRTVATTELPATTLIGIWTAYFGALAVTWLVASLTTRLLLARPAADGASIAVSACYGNVVMLGIPLAATAFGTSAEVPIAAILAVNTPLLWLAGSLHMAIAAADRSLPTASVLATVSRDLVRNPIIVAVIAGSLWRLGGGGLHPLADRLLALLAQAGVPCALVALGLGLTRFAIKGQAATLTSILVLKLALAPAAAAIIAIALLELDPVAAGVVVLFAAMPSGANAYLFAERHQRALNSASGAVALGTILSALTSYLIVLMLTGVADR